jgi:hypothetical protein
LNLAWIHEYVFFQNGMTQERLTLSKTRTCLT